MPVIDVHPPLLNDEWPKRIQEFGGPEYSVKALMPGMFDI
jgi:hypothetical protein